MAVKLAAALHALGLDPADTEFDHDPSLGMRPIDEATGDTIPPANDFRYIVPRDRGSHKAKTFGSHIPLSGDVQKIKKLDRIEKDQAAFRDRLLAKETGADPPAKKHRWAKRSFPKKVKPK